MPQVQTTLTGHNSKSGQKNGKAWTMHLFTAVDGAVYQTFDTGLGNKAYGLLNQPVTAIFEQEPRGDYVNNTLKSVDGVAGAQAATTGVEAAQTGSPPPPQVQTAPAPVAPQNTDIDRQLQIMRQSALERAIRYYGVTGEPVEFDAILALADNFVTYFVQGKEAALGAAYAVPADPGPGF